ncbi:MAG TPA: TadE family protein, partial [Thermomicrobiales bacterium]|nr:TadE family protein [Thermomicrobiales bacterium]
GLVEAAFVLPILLSLTFGIAEMGLYMHDYVEAANCAREAARRAAVRADIVPVSYCPSAALTPSVSPTGYKTAQAGTDVTATVNVTHNWIVIGSLIPGMGTGWPITVSVTMRLEGQAP